MVAVKDATLDVHEGTIHGVIGKNGAGKSVLMSMIAGALQPSGGQLVVAGESVDDHRRWNPRAAQQRGISLIPQEPPKLPFLTVEDYLFLGDRRFVNRGFVNLRAMRQKVAEIDEQLELRIRPGDAMAGLPIEVQQLLAFGKAIYLEDAKVVLLDEITASLSGRRRSALLRRLRELAPGRSFTLITYHINEVHVGLRPGDRDARRRQRRDPRRRRLLPRGAGREDRRRHGRRAHRPRPQARARRRGPPGDQADRPAALRGRELSRWGSARWSVSPGSRVRGRTSSSRHWPGCGRPRARSPSTGSGARSAAPRGDPLRDRLPDQSARSSRRSTT